MSFSLGKQAEYCEDAEKRRDKHAARHGGKEMLKQRAGKDADEAVAKDADHDEDEEAEREGSILQLSPHGLVQQPAVKHEQGCHQPRGYRGELAGYPVVYLVEEAAHAQAKLNSLGTRSRLCRSCRGRAC